LPEFAEKDGVIDNRWSGWERSSTNSTTGSTAAWYALFKWKNFRFRGVVCLEDDSVAIPDWSTTQITIQRSQLAQKNAVESEEEVVQRARLQTYLHPRSERPLRSREPSRETRRIENLPRTQSNQRLAALPSWRHSANSTQDATQLIRVTETNETVRYLVCPISPLRWCGCWAGGAVCTDGF
jgi:hypothetical protein